MFQRTLFWHLLSATLPQAHDRNWINSAGILRALLKRPYHSTYSLNKAMKKLTKRLYSVIVFMCALHSNHNQPIFYQINQNCQNHIQIFRLLNLAEICFKYRDRNLIRFQAINDTPRDFFFSFSTHFIRCIVLDSFGLELFLVFNENMQTKVVALNSLEYWGFQKWHFLVSSGTACGWAFIGCDFQAYITENSCGRYEMHCIQCWRMFFQ